MKQKDQGLKSLIFAQCSEHKNHARNRWMNKGNKWGMCPWDTDAWTQMMTPLEYNIKLERDITKEQ